MKLSTVRKETRSTAKYFLLSVFLLCSHTSHSAEYQYSYPVSGSNADELIEHINRNSYSPDGAFGYTKLNTNVGWTALVGDSGRCEIESVNFSYDITIYMPNWIDKLKAKQCLQDNWDTVWLEVQLHEEKHRELYRLLDIDNIEKRIRSIRPKRSCAALKFAINQEVEKIIDKNGKLHDEFHAADTPPVLWEC